MRKIVRILGVVLILLGLASAGFVWQQTYGQKDGINSAQAELNDDLIKTWSSPPPTPTITQPPTGQPAERLSIPKLGLSWVVAQGTTKQDIRHAPGHYVGTQQPGELGNFAVAGHRTPGIFWDLDRLTVGDVILVETRVAKFTYSVTKLTTVLPTEVSVVAANPDNPTAMPDKYLLTLTTCTPKGQNKHRLVVQAVLVASAFK